MLLLNYKHLFKLVHINALYFVDEKNTLLIITKHVGTIKGLSVLYKMKVVLNSAKGNISWNAEEDQ